MAHESYALASKWGGRHEHGYIGKIDLRRVRLDRQGYAPDGSYFGTGGPVWNVTDHESGGGLVDFYIRAYDKEAAKAKVRAAYPGIDSARRRR